MKTVIERSTDIVRTPRVMQLEGIFDVPPTQRSNLKWNVDLPIEDHPWNVGLIVGPSGCGKSTIARSIFPDNYVTGYEWPGDKSIIDGFPQLESIKDVTGLLSSVGFSSPPSWLRPFHVLSNGEQFRVTLARALAENKDVCVFDEFTSVVDRTVGKIGSAAVAKTVRRRNQKFIAVTCHDDVVDWLDPDWVYSPVNNSFQWRLVRRRPQIELQVCRVHHSAWKLFGHHHYVARDLAQSATCFVAFWEGRPVAFDSWMPFFGKTKTGKARRGHRTVCLPDYQGVGIGNALVRHCASMWAGLGYQVFSCTGHPAEIANRVRSKEWRMTSQLKRHARDGSRHKGGTVGKVAAGLANARASNRLTASFSYIGKPMERALAEKQLNCTWALQG